MGKRWLKSLNIISQMKSSFVLIASLRSVIDRQIERLLFAIAAFGERRHFVATNSRV